METMRLSCRFATTGIAPIFFGDAVAVAQLPVAGRAVDREALLAALQQCRRDRQWIDVDEFVVPGSHARC